MTVVEQYLPKVRQQPVPPEAERWWRWEEFTGLWVPCCQAEGAA